MKWAADNKKDRNIFMFMSSSIGGMSDKDRQEFLAHLKPCLKKGDMFLVGVDLRKDPELIDKAYDKEMARDFSLNNLQRINRELEGTFDLDKFYLHRFYNPLKGENRVMVISKCDQTVTIRGQ